MTRELECRWRGNSLPFTDRYECFSPKLYAPSGVRMETCAACYCRNHPEMNGPAPPPFAPERSGKCTHLFKRVRDVGGAVVRRLCKTG